MTNKEAIDELSVLSERISDGETVNVFVHDGNYGEAIDLAIKALEQTEVKGDLISREALKKAIKNSFKHNLNGYDALLISEIDEFIDLAPTVKPCIKCKSCDGCPYCPPNDAIPIGIE